jgi:hypothetical protein
MARRKPFGGLALECQNWSNRTRLGETAAAGPRKDVMRHRWALVSAIVGCALVFGGAPALAAPAAVIAPNPDDASAQAFGVPFARQYSVHSTGDAFTGRLRGGPLGSSRLARPTITDLSQQQFQVTVPAGSPSLVAEIGNVADTSADLDLFLYDCSTGTCVQEAISAGGGANERVAKANPAAGIHIVLVDGFRVPAGTTAYDYRDTFSLASLGSLDTVDANQLRPTGSTWTVNATMNPLVAAGAGRQITGELTVVDVMDTPIARALVTFRIDTTPPDTSITDGPTGLIKTRTPIFQFASTEAGSTFACAIDGVTLASCSATLTTPVLADGAHDLTVAAVDPAGNVDATAETRTFTVDATAPRLRITSRPRAAGPDRTPTVAFTVDDPAAIVTCRVDGGAFKPCASPFTTPALEDARAHTITVHATDAATNAATAVATFTVTAPTALVTPDVQLIRRGSRRSATPSATLTRARTGAPLRGRVIAFNAGGQQLCTAITDATGVATCGAVVAGSQPVAEYVATFAGTPQFAAATSHAALAACTAQTTLKVKRGVRILKAELRDSTGKRIRRLPKLGRRVIVDLTNLNGGRYTVRVTVRQRNGERKTTKYRLAACRSA